MNKHYIILVFVASFVNVNAQKIIKFRGMQHEVVRQTLSNEQYQNLTLYVKKLSGNLPKDTLCIWFHYNHNNCWQSWDYMHTNKEATDWANHINNEFDKYLQKHKNTSILQARALGNNANKVVIANPKVVFDTERIIENLFFKTPKNCSSSVIIYPDKTCIIINDDPHYDFLYATKKLGL